MAVQQMDNVGIVVESLDDAISFFDALGLELEGRFMIEGVQYEDVYRLCYVRGPEGILIGLAQQIGANA